MNDVSSQNGDDLQLPGASALVLPVSAQPDGDSADPDRQARTRRLECPAGRLKQSLRDPDQQSRNDKGDERMPASPLAAHGSSQRVR